VTVTALLVSHDGARWLPAVLEGLLSQTRVPDRVVAVDTGSTDATPRLLRDRLPAGAVLDVPADTSFPAAVEHALVHGPTTATATAPDDAEWLWLLHDDSRPAPDALEQLLRAAEENPTVAILGPKVREWPSLRRLLEVGVTTGGTGRRETGLERGEYDQGQHDRPRDVLAVGSAGMLVRRDVLVGLGGFDPRLPVFGNDLDLGWRAARAGHRTMVVPAAVVFHAEAAHRGVRRTPLTGAVRRGERRAALYTLLVNCAPVALPFVAVRLVLGSLLRVLGFLLVRAPRDAYDELVALVTTCLRPDRVVAGRRARRRTVTVPPRDVRHLLAPFWLPYRHGLDLLTDIGSAVLHQAADVTAARRTARTAPAETGPVPSEAQALPADTGLLARLVTSPVAAVFAALTLVAVLGMRGVIGSGTLSGGALLPAPGSAAAWWDLYASSWHEIGVGSAAAATPYVLPLAVVGGLLLGKAWLLVDVLFLLCVPLAAWGAHRFLLRLTGARWPSLWGAVAYALLPALTGAVNQGRLGTVAAALLLPWLAHAASYLAPQEPVDRRWRAGWRTALWLALVSAFVPSAWLVAGVLALGAVLTGALTGRRRVTDWGPVAVAVAAVPVLLLPWSWSPLVADGPASWWYAEAGLAASDLLTDLGPLHLLLGRPAEAGAAPGWISAGVVAAAVVALVRRDTRGPVLVAWAVLVTGLAAALVLDAAGHWAGFPLLLAHAAAVVAAAVAGTGISALLAGRSFGWRQPVGLVVVAAAVLSPVAGVLWWAVTGVTGPLDRRPASSIPTYMTDAVERDSRQGILVVASRERGLEYALLRDGGRWVGDDSVQPTDGRQREVTALVADLATVAAPEHVAALSRHGVEFVYLPPPTDPVLVGNLESVSGLASASAPRAGARAWQVEGDPGGQALAEPPDSARPWLLALQAAALVAVAVLAAPSRRTAR
jgi:GT2 family glycosyltransferase